MCRFHSTGRWEVLIEPALSLIIFEASKWVENKPASPGRWVAQLLSSLLCVSTNSLRHIWGFEHVGIDKQTEFLGRLYFLKVTLVLI